MYKKFLSQSDWVDAIMGLVENLDEEGKQDLYERMESEQYPKELTRYELEEKIEDLETKLVDAENENLELQGVISELETQLEEVS